MCESEKTSNQLVSDIKKLHSDMRDLTLDSNVTVLMYDKFIQNIGKQKYLTLTRTHTFLRKVREEEYAEVYRIWVLPTMTPEVWENYLVLFFETTFPEVTLLIKARRNLRKRYSEFHKAKKHEIIKA